MASVAHPDIRRTLLLLRRGGKVLLAMKKRGFGEGKWSGVSGKLESGETIEQALIRECQEEIDVTPVRYHAVAELDFIQGTATNPWHMYVYAFVCDEWEGTPIETEEMAPRWFTIDDIPYDDMWDDDRYWLEQALDDQKIIGEFTFDENDRLIDHSIRNVDHLPHQADSVVA